MKKRGKWNIGNIWKDSKMPLSVRKKISEKARERLRTKSVWNKGKKWSIETRKKISEGRKRNPNLVQQMTKISRDRFKNPDFIKLMDRKSTEFWRSHPNLKKEYSIRFRKYYRTHPEALNALLSYGEKSTKHYLKTKQEFKVKSKGEKEIADFLYNNKIPCTYEAIPLMFRELICIPDFYLPQFNLFIEFYGGHPKAWQKKVQKNIFYKKYKIPVLAITPAELKNLDYFLLKSANKMQKSPICKHFKIHDWINKAGDKV